MTKVTLERLKEVIATLPTKSLRDDAWNHLYHPEDPPSSSSLYRAIHAGQKRDISAESMSFTVAFFNQTHSKYSRDQPAFFSVSELNFALRNVKIDREAKPRSRRIIKAEDRGIEITKPGRNRITANDIPVDDYYRAFVDKVQLYTKDPEQIATGRYFRIETARPGSGTVTFAVDRSTGDVMLVTQYRHAYGDFVSECVRGFTSAADGSEAEGSQRELGSEAKVLPIKVGLGPRLAKDLWAHFPMRCLAPPPLASSMRSQRTSLLW